MHVWLTLGSPVLAAAWLLAALAHSKSLPPPQWHVPHALPIPERAVPLGPALRMPVWLTPGTRGWGPASLGAWAAPTKLWWRHLCHAPCALPQSTTRRALRQKTRASSVPPTAIVRKDRTLCWPALPTQGTPAMGAASLSALRTLTKAPAFRQAHVRPAQRILALDLALGRVRSQSVWLMPGSLESAMLSRRVHKALSRLRVHLLRLAAVAPAIPPLRA